MSVWEHFLAAPQPTLCLFSWPQLPPFTSHLPSKKKGSCSCTFSLLGKSPTPTPPQDLQLPLVVSMQERVWGSPHCKVTTARVHQDVELSEKGERKDIADRWFWTRTGTLHRLARLTALEPRPDKQNLGVLLNLRDSTSVCVMLVFPMSSELLCSLCYQVASAGADPLHVQHPLLPFPWLPRRKPGSSLWF